MFVFLLNVKINDVIYNLTIGGVLYLLNKIYAIVISLDKYTSWTAFMSFMPSLKGR